MSDLKKRIGIYLYPAFKLYNRIKIPLIKYPQSEGIYNSIHVDTMMAYNKTRLWGAKKIFCYNPFVNLFFNTSGNAIACCRSHENILGSYPENSIKEIWTGEKIQSLRNRMLHNDLSMGCAYCALQLDSKRYLNLPSAHAEEFANSKNFKYPRIIELELSNSCNLECVMCSGRVSSAIRQNREYKKPIHMPYDHNFTEQLKEFLPHLKQAHFFGGEPFLIPLYYKIWDDIININPKIELFTVTNGTILNDRIRNIIRKTNFNIVVSLDSLNKERAEFIRKGSNFDAVMTNIKEFINLSKKNICISHTPMTINWFETPDIIKYCNSVIANVNLSYVTNPPKFALWSLMPEKLDEIYKFYNNVKWDGYNTKFIIQYNIRVFEELKNQILFFKNRNTQILNSFTDIDKEWKDELSKVLHFLLEIKTNASEEPHALENFINYFVGLTSKITPSPWSLNNIKKITASLDDKNIVNSKDFKSYLNKPELLQDFFDSYSQSDFFAEYYG